MNMGLVFEAAGRNEEAMASYQTALVVYPNYPAGRAGVRRG